MKIVFGTRGSNLARVQTQHVIGLLQKAVPEAQVEVKIISTTGDEVTDVPLAQIGTMGLFTKQLEKALLDGEIDVAVHSLKDMPTQLPQDLVLAAVPTRHSPYDAFVSTDWESLESLPEGGRVGTSSLRRRAQILARRPDLIVVDLRGNVETRLRKVADGEAEATILACAGLERLGLTQHITQVLPVEVMIPAVSQGALGIEARANFEHLAALNSLSHAASLAEVTAERALMRMLQGGCTTPIGALARFDEKTARLHLRACVADLDGRTILVHEASAVGGDPAELGHEVARMLLADGAAELVARAERETKRP
jgi:hydroxymethylbilane synthase